MTVMNGSSPPMLVAAPQLPTPRIRGNPNLSAAAVSAVVGAELAAPLVALEQAIDQAEAAVRELQDCRPNPAGPDGPRWVDALASDAESAEGERPKVWRTEMLLKGEQRRWATASALAGGVALAVKRTESSLDRGRIASAASVRAAAAQKLWSEAARDGWNAHLADPAVAERCYRSGLEALVGFRDATRVGRWARKEGEPVRRPRDEYPPDTFSLPMDLEGRGRWLCLSFVLHPSRWLRLPGEDDVKWPRGVDELVLDRAIGENVERYTALHATGVYSSRG